ncbi:hypothetical protein PGTUg99_009860 [Puccinia graminis f. sp. tritici]|uniref:Uncharacterized protein n=1 Tax=Puccinia graminis f. sp. tritici TaxID=56615 RepID=A0A5B0S9S8_PUCGR|nr:hypothetical protein PGTUg99_009860 [Puccinia graminis f. sp. tritici]
MSDIEGILLRLVDPYNPQSNPSLLPLGRSRLCLLSNSKIGDGRQTNDTINVTSDCLWELAGNLPLGNFAVAIEIYSKLKTGKPSEAGDRFTMRRQPITTVRDGEAVRPSMVPRN